MTSEQARKKFSRWVDEVGGASEAAEKLGCTVTAVWYIKNGKRNVGLRIAIALQKSAGIPAEAWGQ